MGKRRRSNTRAGQSLQSAHETDEPMSEEASVVIDGSHGEGGGQILRAALALSAVTSKSVRIEKIRYSRPKPGLAAQHLAGARAVARVCDAKLLGARLQSKCVHMTPSCSFSRDVVQANGPSLPMRIDYVTTAGSTALVLQAALPALLKFLPSSQVGEHTVTISGGTVAAAAPLSDYLEHVLCPNLRLLFGIDMTCVVLKHGFFPRGGGELQVAIRKQPLVSEDGSVALTLPPVNVSSRGGVCSVNGRVIIAGSVPDVVGVQMANTARKMLRARMRREQNFEGDVSIVLDRISAESCNGGTVAAITVWASTLATPENPGTVLGASGLVGRSIEDGPMVAETAAEELCDALLQPKVSVDSHMADQLAVFMGMAQGESIMSIGKPSLHTTTVLDVLERFGARCNVEKASGEEFYTLKVRGLAIPLQR